MRAFFEDALKNNVETALEFYTSAIEVLKWGAERWKDVHSEEKGAIFQPTFARGIKCLRLDTLLKVSFVCPVDNVGTHMHYDIVRLAKRIPANSLPRSYLREQMKFSPNLPIHHPSHTYRTLHSSCHSSVTPSEKHTRKLQSILRKTLELIVCAVSVAFASLTRRNSYGKLTVTPSRKISPNDITPRQWNTSRLR